jgi:hypothetical protein
MEPRRLILAVGLMQLPPGTPTDLLAVQNNPPTLECDLFCKQSLDQAFMSAAPRARERMLPPKRGAGD